MELNWHRYDVTDNMPGDLRDKMLEEIQQNNLGPNKVLLDFNPAFTYTSVSIYDANPYHSYFVLKYGDYILRTRQGRSKS